MEVFQKIIKNNYIFLAIAITSIAFVSLVYISSNKDIVDTDMYDGVLSEDEFDNINAEFKEKYLSSNLIKAAKLEDAYLDIMECSFEGAEILKSIIKTAIKNKESLLFWIN